MSGARFDVRTPEQRLADEAARRRRELREEQASHAVTWRVLRAANRMLLQLALRDRMRDPSDFEIYVGADAVTDEGGRIDWSRVAVMVDGLLESRPHLALRPPGAGVEPVLNLLSTGTVEASADVSDHGARWATRDRPGAGENSSPMETP